MSRQTQQGSARARLLVCSLSVLVGSPWSLRAFTPGYHGGLIRQAFDSVREAPALVDVDSAVEQSYRVDDQENDETNQYKHSMRPAGLTLADAQAKADDYRQTFMDTAIRSALRGDLKAAGEALGRLLHLVQDRKHNWCSCGSASNHLDSANDCGAHEGGCSTPGLGNHAMTNCSKLSLETLTPWAHFQLKTEKWPSQAQRVRAVGDSVGVLTEFVVLVRESRRRRTP